MRTDCHQHLWPAEFVEALQRRSRSPRLDGWRLLLDGEPAYDVDAHQHDPRARAKEETETDRVLVSLSSPLGIEHLAPEESAPLLAAWHDGATALGAPFEVWAAANVVEPDPRALVETLGRESGGFVGLQLPATALSTPAELERLGPLLDVLAHAGLPLFVHPGPAATAHADAPSWWPALVPYVQQLHAAWHAWHAAGRANHPTLRVCFAALAGLAPLHHERLTTRGGQLKRIDPDVFYETSSYGTRAVDALIRVVGVDVLVHGSDRPYAEPTDPGLGATVTHALRVANPARLLPDSRRES